MSEQLLPCPFCGEWPGNAYHDDHLICSCHRIEMSRTDWNRRFVCLDMNGDKVYAGDKVKYKLSNWKNKFKDCYVTEFRPPFYGYGLTADDDSDFTAEGFLSSEIELIKEDKGVVDA